MALPTGLVPVAVFALTVGVAVPVTVGTHLFNRSGVPAFGAALRKALVCVGGLYLVGTGVVWAIASRLGQWEVAATLLVAGLVNLLVLTALPLVVGQRIVSRVGGLGSDTALRYATYGWPVAMFAVFAIFVAPSSLVENAFFGLGSGQVCLAGFCGIGRWFVGAVLLELVVVVLGPGIVGLALHSLTGGPNSRPSSS